jgi:hypothetical protein
MNITHDSSDLLVIHDSVKWNKTLFAVIAAFGGLLCLAAIVLVALGVSNGEGIGGAAACVGFAGLACTALGVYLFGLTRDTDYHFCDKEQRLLVRWRNGEKAIPFARIVKADVFDEGDETVAYALRLTLRDPQEVMVLNAYHRLGDAKLKALAERINRFLKV